MLTESQLRQIVPNMKADKVTAYLPHINDAMALFEIDTPLRTAAFIAQLAHESGSFVWMKELWGPTDAQRRYEPPSDLAARLGNTQPGDGRRYMGRGPIQLTGRANYKRFGDALGIDLVGNPDQAATPEVGFRIAGLYWKSRGINAPADADDIREVTRRINGGTNGLADRTAFYERAKQILAESFVADVPTRGAGPAFRLPAEPLERGNEPGSAPAWAAAAALPKKPVAKKAAAKRSAATKPATKKSPAKRAARRR
jgi:predicted chitinase